MKRIIILIILLSVFSINVSAQNDKYINFEDELQSSMPDYARDFFADYDIDFEDGDWAKNFMPENVFNHILKLFKTGFKKPLKSGSIILSIIIISAAFTSLGDESEKHTMALYATVLAVTAIIFSDLWSVLSASVAAIKGCSTFMLSFIPIFCSVSALSSTPVSSFSSGTLLLLAAESVNTVASYGIMPIMGCYLSMSIATCVSPLVAQSEIVSFFKKTAMWILSLVTTLFLGILGIQSTIASSADSVALRTAKFFLGTAVPVAGHALSEALSTISASVLLLKSSLGVYGIVALTLIMLPIIIEIIIWRIVLAFCSIVSGVFSLDRIKGILNAIESMFSVLLGVALLVCGMFIISLTVVIKSGG